MSTIMRTINYINGDLQKMCLKDELECKHT